MKCTAVITIEADSALQKKLKQVFAAEDKVLSNNRASYTIETTNDAVTFNIAAEDGVALRAVMSSITKTLSVFEKTKRIIGETNDK